MVRVDQEGDRTITRVRGLYRLRPQEYNLTTRRIQADSTNASLAVKHDERYKSRLVAGGHLTDTPVESVYSGVVSLRGVRLVIFLAELNGLKVWQN